MGGAGRQAPMPAVSPAEALPARSRSRAEEQASRSDEQNARHFFWYLGHFGIDTLPSLGIVNDWYSGGTPTFAK